MPAPSLLSRLRKMAVTLVVVAALVGVGACSDEEAPVVTPLAGSKPGTQRYLVHLQGAPPDAAAYHEALEEDPAKAVEIAEGLRQSVVEGRKKFVQALKAYDGRVVDHWWLTNAVTVEIPAGNALSLGAIDGVVKVEPDQLLDE